MLLWWQIANQDRIALILYQFDHYKDVKPILDLASHKAPWEVEPPHPEIPVHTDMTEEELGKFMAQSPSRSRRDDD